MDKQKQIEEMAKIMRRDVCHNLICANCNASRSYKDGKCHEYHCAKILLEHYQPKKHCAFKGEYDKLCHLAYFGYDDYYEKGSKETAEKFAEKLKELEDALLGMVVQFCQIGKEGELRHSFMSAEEQAFNVLDINYGEKVYDIYERFNKKWDRPIDEICKEFTGELK